MYADYKFYSENYLLGRASKIPGKEFDYWSMMASGEIRMRTFGNIENLTEIPEEVKMCCCEVAEKLYGVETVKGENGLVLQSYSNDGESGTFKTDGLSDSSVQKSVDLIIRKWLSNTGLMYCGVE